MAGTADLVVRILADTSGAQTNVNALIQTLGKAAGVGAGAGVAGGMVSASMEIQDAMARVQTAYNNTDFTPGTQKYQDAQEAILKFSTTTATSFTDAAAVYAQGARFINEAGQKLDPTQLNEYTDTMLRLSKVSSDQLSPVDIGQRVDVLSKLFGTSDFGKLGSEISGLSGMHNQGEGPGLDAAIAIGQVGADIGVSQEQALAVGNYMADLGLGGQMGGSSIGRLLQRANMGVDKELDPEQQYSEVRKQRDASEKLGDLQNSLAVAEQRRAQMYGQHGLKTAYKRDPAAVMAADNEIAKLQREISDQSQDISHLGDAAGAGTGRGAANIGAMAGLMGEDKSAFAQEFQTDPLGTLLKWTKAISQLPETERMSAMTKAFGGRGGAVNVRDQKIIAALANPDRQGSLESYLAEAMGQSESPTDLATRSAIPLGTTSAKVTDVANAIFGEAGAAGGGPRQAIDAGASEMLKAYSDNTGAVNNLNATLTSNPLIGTISTGVIAGVATALPILLTRLLAGGGAAASAVAAAAGSAASGATGAASGLGAAGSGLGIGAISAAGSVGLFAAGDALIQDQINKATGQNNPNALEYWSNPDKFGKPYSDLGNQINKDTGISINIGDINAHSLEDVLSAVKQELTAAWTAAHQGTPVSGVMGGAYVPGSGPR